MSITETAHLLRHKYSLFELVDLAGNSTIKNKIKLYILMSKFSKRMQKRARQGPPFRVLCTFRSGGREGA